MRHSPLPTDVCIIGTSMLTPVGLNAGMSSASFRCGVNRFQASHMIDHIGNPITVSRLTVLSDALMGGQRMVVLCLRAIAEALLPVSRSSLRHLRSRLIVGLPDQRPGIGPEMRVQVAEALKEAEDSWLSESGLELLPFGGASGLMALHRAATLLAEGGADFCVVGGTDSYWHFETLEWMDATERLHSETHPDGFVPGEGAAFCLLTTRQMAMRLRMPPLAFVQATAVAVEPHPRGSEAPVTGDGLTRALRSVLEEPSSSGQAHWTLCDLNGESRRTTEWMYAYLRTGGHHRNPLEVWHPADCWGDVGAASGPLLVGLAVHAFHKGYARGTSALIWSASDGSERAAALLERE